MYSLLRENKRNKKTVIFLFIYSLSACNLRLWQLYNKYNFLETISDMLK